ncbi:MAG: Uma2 family endonuclease [Mesorhizobium sp.]|nr:Uma2 family endonuclease [Mesorhizobium sp.]MBL8579322.1 Uma2 family endonuclease [Mesorhizobium sp.]
MNEHIFKAHTHLPGTTMAAEGMPRRAWTVAEIEAMVEAGIIDGDERFELIGGEVVPMSPKGARHELVKIELNRNLQQTLALDLSIAPETTLRLDEKSFVEPDFCVFPRSIAPGDMRGYDVLLAIEIADTSLRYDLGRKIGTYAAYGIAEVWVINALTLVTRVHRQLGPEGYRDIAEFGPDATLTAVRVPSVSICLSALGLRPV